MSGMARPNGAAAAHQGAASSDAERAAAAAAAAFGAAPPSLELLQFEAFAAAKCQEDWGHPVTQVRMAFHLLRGVLDKRYGGSMRDLVAKASRAGESAAFATAASEVAREIAWSRATLVKYFHVLKRVLRLTSVDASFLTMMRLASAPRTSYNKIIGEKYGSLDESNAHRRRLEEWISVLRGETRNSSDASLRNVISFFLCQCLPKLGLSLEQWPEDPVPVVESCFAANPDLAELICGADGDLAAKKARWLRTLLRSVLKTSVQVPERLLKPRVAPQPDGGDGSDVHRISAGDLEKLQAQSKRNILDELLFTLMITTGLRVGGVTLILTDSVADVDDHRFVVRAQGRTREKGNKWAHFCLTPRVQELVREWLTKHRPAINSPYLFPGVTDGTHVTTNAVRGRFARLCTSAGLSGKQFHPHALRHSFAHMLLEAGNSVDVVAKCLNHSSSTVTETVYLKESAVEVMKRANIPWLPCDRASAPALPSFLGEPAPGEGARDAAKHDAKRRKTSSALSSLQMFRPLLEK